jgi:hypothetical protein
VGRPTGLPRSAGTRRPSKTFIADPKRFQDSFGSQTSPLGNYRGSFTHYWLTVENGVVAQIEEQYLP